MLPPFIIYEKTYPSGNYVKNSTIGALYKKSPYGYMDKELLQEWLEKIFVPKTRHLWKVLLIIDGHGSHVTLDVIDLVRENEIILLCLSPPTT